MVNSDQGEYKANRHATQPARGRAAPDFWPRRKLQGKDQVLGFSLKRDTGWVGKKFVLGSAEPRLACILPPAPIPLPPA